MTQLESAVAGVVTKGKKNTSIGNESSRGKRTYG